MRTTETAAARPVHDKPTHLILRWSGKPEDEAPLCGAPADGDNFTRRTEGREPFDCAGNPMPLCEACVAAVVPMSARRLAEEAKDLVSNDGEWPSPESEAGPQATRAQALQAAVGLLADAVLLLAPPHVVDDKQTDAGPAVAPASSPHFYRPVSATIQKADGKVDVERAIRLYCSQAGSSWTLQVRGPISLANGRQGRDFIIAGASLNIGDLAALRDAIDEQLVFAGQERDQ